jgi:hypothetical protein
MIEKAQETIQELEEAGHEDAARFFHILRSMLIVSTQHDFYQTVEEKERRAKAGEDYFVGSDGVVGIHRFNDDSGASIRSVDGAIHVNTTYGSLPVIETSEDNPQLIIIRSKSVQ